MALPLIIQGGMGVGVSGWKLARAVAQLGQLGVVSGTALDQVLSRRLQDADPGGHMRRALDHFPYPEMAEHVWDTYYRPDGKRTLEGYKPVPMQTVDAPRSVIELWIVANFAEVFLAREGHDGPVGINYLEKIQIPHLASIYGALLAGVDYVIMGAGIPLKIPGALDLLARGEPASYPLSVTGAQPGDHFAISFDPRDYVSGAPPELTRPKFLAIIASDVLALTLARKANGRVDGFIVEGPAAGGHNAPPRGKPPLSTRGEPVYGERDNVDLAKLRLIGLPFWLAGGYGAADRMQDAIDAGAVGIQVGTAFALCAESGLADDHRRRLLQKAVDGTASVFTDPLASPAGFPFKVAQLEGTLSEASVYQARPRICDLGYLREAYRGPEGTVEFRCPAQPVSVYVASGGTLAATEGRKCVCNALLANIDQPQVRAGKYVEAGMLTTGDDLTGVTRFLSPGAVDYRAADVVAALLRRTV